MPEVGGIWLGEDGWDRLLQTVCGEGGARGQRTQPWSSGGKSPSHSPPLPHAVLRLLGEPSEGGLGAYFCAEGDVGGVGECDRDGCRERTA
jgi:hypothetical protein